MQKPRNVVLAEIALWAWTAWACLYGIYDTWKQIPELKVMMTKTVGSLIQSDPAAMQQMPEMGDFLNVKLGDVLPIDIDSLLPDSIAFYGFIAVVSAFFVYKVGKGKKWARSSCIWGFGIEVLFLAVWACFTAIDYVDEIPELGLQVYALVMLYTSDSNKWFDAKSR